MNIKLCRTEKKQYEQFQKDHKECYCGAAIGGKFSLICTPTGVGTIFVALCNACKKKRDITDYSTW